MTKTQEMQIKTLVAIKDWHIQEAITDALFTATPWNELTETDAEKIIDYLDIQPMPYYRRRIDVNRLKIT